MAGAASHAAIPKVIFGTWEPTIHGRASRDRVGGRLHLPRRSLPHSEPAAVRALLPLPLVPARDRRAFALNAMIEADRVVLLARRARGRRHAVQQRQGPEDRALSGLPDRACGATTPAPAMPFTSSASARSMSPTACRPTSTSSPSRSSPGWSCRPTSPRCRIFDRRAHWPAESLERMRALTLSPLKNGQRGSASSVAQPQLSRSVIPGGSRALSHASEWAGIHVRIRGLRIRVMRMGAGLRRHDVVIGGSRFAHPNRLSATGRIPSASSS